MAPPSKDSDGRQNAPSGARRVDALARLIEPYKAYDQKVAAGHDVFVPDQPAEGLHCLLDGWAFHYERLQEDLRRIEQFVLPGDVLSLRSSGDRSPTLATQALTDLVVSVIPPVALARLAKDHPDVFERLIAFTPQTARNRFHDIAGSSSQSELERVSQKILELFGRFRARWPGQRNADMQLPLTAEHIADAVGYTASHTRLALAELMKMGIVSVHELGLSVLDPDALMDAARIDSQLFLSWLRGEENS